MFHVSIDLTGLDTALEPLKPGGEVQTWFDNEFIKHCEPYVPRKEGVLAGSAWLSTEIGSGQIIYSTPYAEKMYTSPELDFRGKDDSPARGAFWAERMWADRGEEIVQGAAKRAGGRKG